MTVPTSLSRAGLAVAAVVVVVVVTAAAAVVVMLTVVVSPGGDADWDAAGCWVGPGAEGGGRAAQLPAQRSSCCPGHGIAYPHHGPPQDLGAFSRIPPRAGVRQPVPQGWPCCGGAQSGAEPQDTPAGPRGGLWGR